MQELADILREKFAAHPPAWSLPAGGRNPVSSRPGPITARATRMCSIGGLLSARPRTILGWEPQVSFEQSEFAETLDYFLQDLVRSQPVAA